MRAVKPNRAVVSRLDDSFETRLALFSAATLEINPSLGTTEFAQRLTSRAAEMFGARATVLALPQGSAWEISSLSGAAHRWDAGVKSALARAMAQHASLPGRGMRSVPAAGALGRDLSEVLVWRSLLPVKLMGSDDSVLGILALVDLPGEQSSSEVQLLEALVSHASVALENARLFSRIEQSRKQWVEDFDAITDYIVVHDMENRVLRLNRALADLLKLRLVNAAGRPMDSLEILGVRSLPGRCPFCRDPESEREEFVLEARDRYFLVSASRIRSRGEEGPRTIHILKDISDRREAERRFRRERDFNKNILNNTQSMILVLDTAGLVSYANRRCFETGFSEQDLLGRPLADKVPPARRPIFVEALKRAIDGVPADNLEVPLVTPAGIARQFSVSLSPMRDDQGEIISIVVVMTDVTDAADLQARLMHTEKMAALGQLVSGVAHEVNNPLAAIVGFTDLLLENSEVPDPAKEDLRVILQEAQRTRLIVQNLLSFARQMPPQREPIQVGDVIRQTLKLRAYDFSNHGVEVAERCPEDLPLVIGDPHQLQQVFLNILNNAYDAVQETRRTGKIEIDAELQGSFLEIRFRDNGPGIAHPDRIFDPFFTTKGVGKGTGLGLSICYGIVRAHGGEISAQNNDRGPGCTFKVRLPVAATSIADPDEKANEVLS
jgi:PAS domain S-box-containing protein